MPLKQGSLTDRVMQILMREGSIVAGMVIDEQGSSHGQTAAQALMLTKLTQWYCPIILVEQNPPLRLHTGNLAPPATRRTISELRSVAGGRAKRVIKGYFNAMVQTDLDEKLAAENIAYVVIMGQQTNCCVRCTAIGASDIDRQAHPGLVQNNIRVLSALSLMFSTYPSRDFLDHPMVEIYADA
ncbi:MAG: isochorismatase family protein [Rubrivivax sp.]|nr:isochorismatase family protein [Rubrivivax sp.]